MARVRAFASNRPVLLIVAVMKAHSGRVAELERGIARIPEAIAKNTRELGDCPVTEKIADRLLRLPSTLE